MRILLFTAVASFFLTNGFAATLTLTGDLTGPKEFPPVASPGTGSTVVVYDDVAHTLAVDVTFSDLTSPTTASHIHCCVLPSDPMPTAGVATTTPTFVGFPLGVMSGTFSTILDLTDAASFRAGFIMANGGTAAGAEAALAAGLAAGMAYLNVHTADHPGGEIRSFLTPVPEPGTALLLGAAFAGLYLVRRRR
jgi:hypothetical protein